MCKEHQYKKFILFLLFFQPQQTYLFYKSREIHQQPSNSTLCFVLTIFESIPVVMDPLPEITFPLVAALQRMSSKLIWWHLILFHRHLMLPNPRTYKWIIKWGWRWRNRRGLADTKEGYILIGCSVGCVKLQILGDELRRRSNRDKLWGENARIGN